MVTMAIPTQTLTFTRTINAPVAQVYQSFVSRDDICDWLCYNALLDAAIDGHIFVNWYDATAVGQTHAYGRFTLLEENARVAFTWNDAIYDGTTHLDFTFSVNGDGVTVTANHSGFAENTSSETIQHYSNLWEDRLTQLKSILEVGGPANIVERVIIGIIPGELNAENAKTLGVPAEQGVLVRTVLDGFSAASAGLLENDVIVAVNGAPMTNGNSIHAVTGELKPGDTVMVEWYRGAEKHKADMVLRGYPVPPIPQTWDEMQATFAERHANLETLLDEALTGYNERHAEARLNDNARTVPEHLANIILRQRHTLQYFASYAHGPRIITPFTNSTPWIRAIVTAFPTVDALRDELRRVGDEIVAVIGQFPDELLERKNYAWWMNFEVALAVDEFDRIAGSIQETIAA